MEAQVHIGTEQPSAKGMTTPIKWRGGSKPDGGFWTSTYDPEYLSGWARWCVEESFGAPLPWRWWRLTPTAEARVYTVATYDDLNRLVNRYRLTEEQLPFPSSTPIDWPAVALDWDAVHLTDGGQWATRLTHPYDLYGWDCESTLWFRWSFSAVEDMGLWTPAESEVLAEVSA